MIERSLVEFTELDNDYITLWSQLIMSKEDIVDGTKLTALAELGNVNAICAYFAAYQGKHKNRKVDDKLTGLFLEDDNIFQMYYYISRASKVHGTLKEDKFLKNAFVAGMKEFEKNPKNILLAQKLYDIKWVDWSNKCEYYMLKCMPKTFERFDWEGLEKIRVSLLKEMEKNPDDPRYAFYFARCVNIYIFGNQVELLPEGTVEKRTEILENLANRPLSYELQHKLKFDDYDRNPLKVEKLKTIEDINNEIDAIVENYNEK